MSTARAENSVRIEGVPESRIGGVTLENVDLTLDRWTAYPGGVFDNRPTAALRTNRTACHSCDPYPLRRWRYASKIAASNWGNNRPDYFTHALEAEQTANLSITRLTGEAAHPERDPAIFIH